MIKAGELLALAKDLQSSAPNQNEDPREWMRRAKDFADICMIDRRLAPTIADVVPLKHQGTFLRAVKAIDSASGSYNSGLRGTIDDGLATITEILRGDSAPALRVVTVESLAELSGGLTETQKQILDLVWQRHTQHGDPYPVRTLQPIIGKKSVEEVLQGISGSLIFEKEYQGSRALQLRLLGALVTPYGISLFVLLIRLADFVKQLYATDSYIKEIDKDMVERGMNLSRSDWQQLFAVMTLGLPAGFPVAPSQWTQSGDSWQAKISDDVMSLYRAGTTEDFVGRWLANSYRADEPVSFEARRQEELTTLPLRNVPPFARAVPTTSARHSYVHQARVKELQSVQNSDFDCTRLVGLCNELNVAAENECAHAVIMLTRAIMDHVPPALGFETFGGVANYYKGDKSLKDVLQRLEQTTRKVADRLLHSQISSKQVMPYMNQVDFAAELDVLLSEVYRKLK